MQKKLGFENSLKELTESHQHAHSEATKLEQIWVNV